VTRGPRVWSVEDRGAPFVDVFKRSARRAGYEVCVITPKEEPPGFTLLRRHYRHLSPNPARFELASFRRWFEIAAVVPPDERVLVADSDIVVQGGFLELPEELRDTASMVGSIGATDDVLEKGVSGGFSLWSGLQLRQFCDYVVSRYESGADRLAELYEWTRKAGRSSPGVSDMTLLHDWVRDAGVPFVNSNRIIDGTYIDHNFSMPGCLGARFRTVIGLKALRFTHDGFWLLTREGNPVRPICLHLVGRCKILARDIEGGNQARLAMKSLYILGGRMFRRQIGRLSPRT